MRCALFTFTIGDKYVKEFADYFRPSVEKYCKKYSIDLVVATEPFVPFVDKHDLCCQKLLICSQPWASKYDAIAWIDADIIISPNARNIFEEVKGPEVLFVQHEPYNDTFHLWNWRHKLKLTDKAFDDYTPDVNIYGGTFINEGVMVFQPTHHADYLQNLFNSHDFTQPIEKIGVDGTSNPIGEIWFWSKIMQDLPWRLIDIKYNNQWNYYRRVHLEPYDDPNSLVIPAKNYIQNSYFCHIGDRENMDVIHFVEKHYFRKETTLVVLCEDARDLGWLLLAPIRAREFKDIYIVCRDDSAKFVLYNNYPRMQYGYYLPKVYTFVSSVPELSGRVIQCTSKPDIQKLIDAFYEDNEYVISSHSR